MVWVYSVKFDTNKGKGTLVIKKDNVPIVGFIAENNTIVKLAAVLVTAKNIGIEVMPQAQDLESKQEKEEKTVPVYKRPRKDVSPATKNAVLNVVKNLYGDGRLFHVRDILDVIDDISYSVANAALGHLAHEGYLEKVSRGRKVYYRYTRKKKMQKVLR